MKTQLIDMKKIDRVCIAHALSFVVCRVVLVLRSHGPCMRNDTDTFPRCVFSFACTYTVLLRV